MKKILSNYLFLPQTSVIAIIRYEPRVIILLPKLISGLQESHKILGNTFGMCVLQVSFESSASS